MCPGGQGDAKGEVRMMEGKAREGAGGGEKIMEASEEKGNKEYGLWEQTAAISVESPLDPQAPR